MASISSSPRTVEEIFKDYNARRTGIVRALTYGTSCINIDTHVLFLIKFRSFFPFGL